MIARRNRPPLLRRIIGLVAALGIAVSLGACTGIPDSGPVNANDPGEPNETLDLDILARPPQPGGTQDEILDGFILAAASPRNDYQVAKQFLTPTFVQEWTPGAGVTIDGSADDRVVTTTSETTKSVTIRQSAGVASNGEYREVDPTSRTLDYAFEQVNGEWRLSNAPAGVLVDEPLFSRVFNRHVLYFYDPTFTYLVPDLRWFATRRESVQTSIVRELLRGPAEWLAPGVVSAFPSGATLTSDAVPVTAREANVDLTGEAVPDDLATLQRMKLQLTVSLDSVPTIREVSLSIDGRQEDVPDLAVEPSIDPRVDPRSIVYRDGEFGYLSFTTQAITPIEGISSAVESLAPIGVALGEEHSAAAVLAGDGVHAVRAESASLLLDTRPNLITPAIDDFGIIWSVPRESPGQIRWFAPDGSTGEITAPWSDADNITSLAISRDGTRLLALVDRGGQAAIVVSAIARAPDLNLPDGLGDPFDIPNLQGAPLDAAWLDPYTVGALILSDDGATTLVTQQIGGTQSRRGGPADGRWLAGSNTTRDARLLTTAGEIMTQSGVTWQPRAEGIVLLASQQGVGQRD